MVLLALACTPTHYYPADEDPSDSDPASDSAPDSDSDTGERGDISLESGDPIELTDTYRGDFAEWMDAEILEDGRAAIVGVTGFAMYDTVSREVLHLPEGHGDGRAYRVAVDGTTAWVGTRADQIRKYDLSGDDPAQADLGPNSRPLGSAYHEDISADGGLVALAGIDQGLYLLDDDANVLKVIAGDAVIGTKVVGDRVYYTDGQELVLLDVTYTDQPVELDRIELRGTGRDIDVEGEHIVVAMGGSGADVFKVVDDVLSKKGQLDLPGSAFGVDVDGDWAWIAAWEVVGLAWLGEGGPIMVGHEDPEQSAMGLGARDGVALIGDWQNMTVMERTGDKMGPEVHPPGPILYQSGNDAPLPMVWTNFGAETLEITLQEAGLELSETELSLEPGEGKLVTITLGNSATSQIAWSSNDPDEPTGQVLVDTANTGLGTEHPEMTLSGFVPPSQSVETYSLSDYAGKPVFIGYWTTW
ncbi:MAG: hypothetical protein GY913_07690 [Proteobacteria bacterium]|nr:hypothetical protein [Pseudomonadota bacterium]MCP4916793.1 hypothetical protein [Pseudomonadota bacterium]